MSHAIRRIAAIAAVAGLTAVGVAGCSSAASDEDVTLSWWAPNLSPNLGDDQTYYEELVKPFTDETGIAVDIEVNAWGDYYNKILGAITSGEGGDVISTGTTWVSTLSDSGGFAQFGDAEFDAVGGRDQFVPSALAAAGGDRDGGPAMLPWVTGVTQMWYNPVLFAEAGITAPPATWEEFLAAAKALTKDTDGDGTIDQWGFGYPAGFAQEWAHTMFAFGEQNDAPFFTDDGTPNLDAEGMVAAAKQFTDLITVEKVLSPGTVEDTSFDKTVQNFVNGSIAITFGPGLNTNFGAAGFEDYAVAQIPLNSPLAGKPVTTHIAGVNLGLFADTPHRDQALQLLEYLSSTDVQVQLYDQFPGILPANAAAYDSDAVEKTEVFTVSADILKDTAAGYPISLYAAQAETVIGDAMKAIAAQAATSGAMSEEQIRSTLEAANSQMKASQ
ncbi:extracellular solute-binding protein [Agromyces atrinae]|uniref:ABC transporter substrate-binding protein n=1 Tax=Agromyces atrinae TaxID=592376 RepID=UPI001F56D91B|nr:extracellular solute-binding protein [Agromyces atrinae]MCI2956911.1 extracellular solute-binding protein [Agromyces atrinae]